MARRVTLLRRCEVCRGRRVMSWVACYGDVAGPVPSVQVACPRCTPPYLPIIEPFRRSA